VVQYQVPKALWPYKTGATVPGYQIAYQVPGTTVLLRQTNVWSVADDGYYYLTEMEFLCSLI